MSCVSSNCKVMLVEPSELTEVIWLMPGISENCRSSGVATFEAMVSGLAPGSVTLDLDGREVHVRQRRHRQVEIADDPHQQERGRDQRGRDRTMDEGAREAHCVADRWDAGVAAAGVWAAGVAAPGVAAAGAWAVGVWVGVV